MTHKEECVLQIYSVQKVKGGSNSKIMCDRCMYYGTLKCPKKKGVEKSDRS